MNKNHVGAFIATLFLFVGLLVAPAGTAGAAPDICGPLDSGKIDTSGDPQTVTVTAPAGNLITGYCVKAGNVASGVQAVVYVDVIPPQETVVISHPSQKAVSHYSYSYAPLTTTTTTSTTVPQSTTTTAPTTTSSTTTIVEIFPPTTVASPTTTTTTSEPPFVGSGGPTPPAATPEVAAPTQLPSTGSSTWNLAMVALTALLGGMVLVVLSRRTV